MVGPDTSVVADGMVVGLAMAWVGFLLWIASEWFNRPSRPRTP